MRVVTGEPRSLEQLTFHLGDAAVPAGGAEGRLDRTLLFQGTLLEAGILQVSERDAAHLLVPLGRELMENGAELAAVRLVQQLDQDRLRLARLQLPERADD